MNKLFKKPNQQEEGSDAGSESDATSSAKGSRASPERGEVGATGRNREFFQKRPKSGEGQESSSDGGPSSARRKISRRGGTQDRGMGRGLTTQGADEPSRAGPAEPAQGEDMLVTEGHCSGGTNNSRALSESSGGEPDATSVSNLEISANMDGFAQLLLAELKNVSLKRLQASKDKAISEAMATILEAARPLCSGPASDGLAELRAEVARLTAAVELLQKENAELRANHAGPQGAGPRVVAKGGAQHRQGGPLPAEDQGLALVRQELAAISSRFSALEAIVLRPPLAASRPASGQPKAAPGQPKASAGQSKVASGSGQPKVASGQPKAASFSAVAAVPARGSGQPKGQPKKAPARAPTKVVRERPVPPPTAGSPPATAEWQVVGEKKKAGKAARKARNKKRQQRRKKSSVAARLRAPKSAAVVITLQPEAEKKGVTYRDLLSKAKAAVDLQEIGISNGLRVKVTLTGARMLEVPGAASGPAADALADRLRASLDADEARVSRPTKCADMRILGLDDCVTEAEVVAAIVRTGGCSADQVRAGTIRPDSTGMSTITVSCPVSAAQKITAEGRRLLVGWVSAQVKLLEPRPLRCFRCQTGHHVYVKCTSEVDRSGHCFRCGQPGHKAGSCNATPHCYACAAAGKPAEHRAGSKACASSAKARGKGKPSATAVTAVAAAASTTVVAGTTTAGPSQGAQEGAEMECQ